MEENKEYTVVEYIELYENILAMTELYGSSLVVRQNRDDEGIEIGFKFRSGNIEYTEKIYVGLTKEAGYSPKDAIEAIEKISDKIQAVKH